MVNGSSGALSAAALNAVILGATTASAQTAGLTAVISSQIAQTSASVSIDTIATDDIINTSEQGSTTITGTNTSDATVNLSIGGITRATTAIDPAHWSYALTDADITAMNQGGETLTATATLAGGGTASATRSFVVDTTAPVATAAIGTVTDNVGALTGTLTSGDATDDTTLALAGTIYDALGAGEVVTVYDGNTRLGIATVSSNGSSPATGNATSSGTGSVTVYGIAEISFDSTSNTTWSYTDSTLTNGDAVSYTVRVEDAAGNQGTASTVFTITIDTTVPIPSAPDLSSDSDSGSSNTDNLTNVTTPTFTGTAEAGATVTLLEDATVLGIATADSGGAWHITSSTLAQGTHNISARQTDMLGNVSAASSALAITIDTTPPLVLNASFTETTNASISITFDEAVTALNTNDLAIDQYDGQSGLFGVPGGLGSRTDITPTGVSGAGTTMLTISTSSTLRSTDTVLLIYDASSGNVSDLAGNSASAALIGIGGSDASNINLSNLIFLNPPVLYGNDGNDTLTGTNVTDTLIDGAGADILIGGRGADSIRLIENGSSLAYASDIVKIGLCDSTALSVASIDRVTGFDAKSTIAVNHDVLDLPSNVIVGNATNVDGADVGLFATHSITSGIVSFKTTGGSAILVDMNNGYDAVAYLATNIHSPGATMAFEVDTDNNGSADSLAVFQDNGTVPLAGNYTLLDTVALLKGVTGVTLGTAAGANVVQIQDTQGAVAYAAALTSTGANDGVTINFTENTYATASLAMTMQKNGAGTIFTPTSVDGSGTTSLTIHFAGLSLAPTDWVLRNDHGWTASDWFSDASGNRSGYIPGEFGITGGSGDNTIDLSAFSGSNIVNSHAGNDTLIGSSGMELIIAGTGADTITGGVGNDMFLIEQGDSPAITFAENGGTGISTGDTFTFSGGLADRITDFSDSDAIALLPFLSAYTGFSAYPESNSPGKMAAIPADGLATDQGFFLVQGGYDNGTGVFTTNSAGTDTLVVYDGDSTAAVTQTGIVLSEVTLDQLDTWTGKPTIRHIDTSAPAPSAPDLSSASDSGSSNSDNITNVTTPTFTGTAEAGALVTLLEDSVVLGTATADSGGAWNITSSTLTEGVHNISARQTDVAGNVSAASAVLAVTIDASPHVSNASFSETTNASISITFSEAVTARNTNGLKLRVYDGQSDMASSTAITPTGVSGIGTTTLTISTSFTLKSTDIVLLSYDASSGNVTDLTGDALNSGQIWIGSSGASNINLSDWLFLNPPVLYGNGGTDTLTGTVRTDFLVDGEGADTLNGRHGADNIHLVENGVDKAYARDIVKIALGDSPAYSVTSIDTITGFDAKSATAANHDVLDLQSKVIAGDVTNVNGADVGLFATHSITSGIVSFKAADGSAILVDLNNANDAVAYLATNINSPGETMAFEMDADNNGSADSLAVFQDNGTPDYYALPDTVAVLGGVTGVTLGATAGANVVQIQDTQGPKPTGFALISDGMALNFAENTFATSSLAFTVQKNGVGAVYAPTSVDGSGATSLAVHYAGLSLAQSDWLLCTTAATNTSDGFSDGFNTYGVGREYALTVGGSADNTIDLSTLTNGYEINGDRGNDTLIGSSGNDMIIGGSDADTLTGAGGTDLFDFGQGSSPAVTVNLNAGWIDGVLDNGDPFTFAGGLADRITDFSSGERIYLNGNPNDVAGLPPVNKMAATPTNGLATDQGFFVVQGRYDTSTGVFSGDDWWGSDTLVVYDGDSTAAVTQAGIVLSGVTLAQLHTLTGTNFIAHV